MPSADLLARITIAAAFQRMNARIRRSMSSLPGKNGWFSAGIVLMGVEVVGGTPTCSSWPAPAVRRDQQRARGCPARRRPHRASRSTPWSRPGRCRGAVERNGRAWSQSSQGRSWFGRESVSISGYGQLRDSAADRTVVYTDGACRTVLAAGVGTMPDGPWANGFDPDTTNRRMELMAVLDAMRTIEGAVEIVSDSTYVVNCFRDGWWKGWLKRGWKNSKRNRSPTATSGSQLIDLYRSREGRSPSRGSRSRRRRVQRHRRPFGGGGITRSRGRHGVGTPDDLGPLTKLTQADPFQWPRSRDPTACTRRRGCRPVRQSSSRSPATAARRLRPQPDRRRRPPPAHRDPRGQGRASSGSRRRHRSRLGAETLAAEAAAGGRSCRSSPCCRSPPGDQVACRNATAFTNCSPKPTRSCGSKKVPADNRAAGQALDRRNGWLRKTARKRSSCGTTTSRGSARSCRRSNRCCPTMWIVSPSMRCSAGSSSGH